MNMQGKHLNGDLYAVAYYNFQYTVINNIVWSRPELEKSSNILLQMGQNWQKSIFLATFSPNNKNWGVAELQVVLLVGLT